MLDTVVCVWRLGMTEEMTPVDRVAEIKKKVLELELSFAAKKEDVVSKSPGAEARDKLLEDAREAIRLREEYRDKDMKNFNLQHRKYAELINVIAELENDILASEAPEVVIAHARESARLDLEIRLITIDMADPRKLLKDDVQGVSNRIVTVG